MAADPQPLPKYKVISDGTPQGTKILTPGGERMRGVRAIRLDLDADNVVGTMHLEIWSNAIDIEAEVPEPGVTEIHKKL